MNNLTSTWKSHHLFPQPESQDLRYEYPGPGDLRKVAQEVYLATFTIQSNDMYLTMP